MLGNYQKYEVTVKFTYESETFPEDPDDVYELADLEKGFLIREIEAIPDNVEIQELAVVPVIGD